MCLAGGVEGVWWVGGWVFVVGVLGGGWDGGGEEGCGCLIMLF